MLLIVLALLWTAVFAPIILRKVRDKDADRSIVNFHERMARLSNSAPLVAPAHRLAVNDETPPRELLEYEVNPPTRAPRLRVVPVDATVEQLERQQTWDEWTRAYSDDPFEGQSSSRPAVTMGSSRAVAYSRVPVQGVNSRTPVTNYGTTSQRVRRRRTLLALSSSTLLSTFTVLLSGSIFIEMWALVSWVTLLGFLGLMYYAMSVGMLGANAAQPMRLVNPREYEDDNAEIAVNEFDLAYDPRAPQWDQGHDVAPYRQAL